MECVKNRFCGWDVWVWMVLVNVGGSVFLGIMVIKILGVMVLVFMRSKIFEIYYFRVWVVLVVFVVSYVLVFLLVVLSLGGGEGWVDLESEGGLEVDLISWRYRVLMLEEELDLDVDV